MSSFNKVILMGNLTRDPELRSLPSGTTVVNFGLAVSERWKDKNTGEQREEVCFVDVDAFGRQGEVVSEYFSKGKPILVEGRLRFRQWETDSGEKRSKLSVTLDRFSFVGSRQDSEFQDGGSGTGSAIATATDDDIPF
ncbi:single-stranded DNA-binding protein [Candidatus Poribacteria bacterium]|jgi:single-strand DNA-binding protein|nr:single-stranded DNA-binding protein [Candidatus Poribacteria bacterium]MDP6750133.1 single-stranded DNA-binding protein [Candidatus Poribacteria bacterium]MDP6997314.1 single-stranded DNA-binding protein [Candidatus Poribacteria bacterium]